MRRGETAKDWPRIIDMGAHELCRFDNGQWSLRFKMNDGDVSHVRYLNDHEIKMVEAALRSHGGSAQVPDDEEIAALFRKRDALKNPLSVDEVDDQIDRLLRRQFAERMKRRKP